LTPLLRGVSLRCVTGAGSIALVASETEYSMGQGIPQVLGVTLAHRRVENIR
jgi:hypothetical protein